VSRTVALRAGGALTIRTNASTARREKDVVPCPAGARAPSPQIVMGTDDRRFFLKFPRPLARTRGVSPLAASVMMSPIPLSRGDSKVPHASGEAAADTAFVRGVVARVLGKSLDHPDVEDCAHEALRRALEGRARLRDGEPVRPWLAGIARHVAIDGMRKRARERTHPVPLGDADEREIGGVEDLRPTAEDRLVEAERARAVHDALATLPPAQRDALAMFHVEGLDYAAIAARMGVPLGTVATWIARGRRTLAEKLERERRKG
jgi:RNA polymerase sigma factor (sigma-70 family)